MSEKLQTWESVTDSLRARYKKAWRMESGVVAYDERPRVNGNADDVLVRNWEAGFMTRKVAVWAIVQHTRDPVMGPEKHVLDVFRYVEKSLAEEVLAHLRARFPSERIELEMLKVDA